jgi:AmmeMemoRadiSam system protein B
MHAPADIRISDIMGTWYPADPVTLRRTIEGFLERVPAQPLGGELRALVAPHAGYQFSGPTAAYSYKQVAGKSYDAVVVVGPSHRAWLGEFAVSAEKAYLTPLGPVPLAQDLIAQLDRRIPVARVREAEEHSIELQLPFLQITLGPFRLIPILMSAGDLDSSVRLGQALAVLSRRHNILLVASTDLNHLSSYDAVRRRDADVISAVEGFNLHAMAGVLLAKGYTVCGRAPLLAVSAAAQALGASRVRVLHSTNSGDVTGRKTEGTYTVGYFGAAITT